MNLAEADSGLTNMAMSAQQGRYQGDEFLLVKYFMHARLHPSKTAAAQRPIYEDTVYISIMQPGNKDSIVIRPATEMDKARFAEHWRKYEARQGDDGDVVEGTPLAEWAGVTRAQCEELRYFNVRSVEQLAAMSDSNGQNIMGINLLKQKAVKYLEASKDSATTDALAAANARIDELMAMMSTPDTATPDTIDPDQSTPAEAPKRRRKAAAE